MAEFKQILIKQRNRNDIFKLIFRQGCVTKQQLMQTLSLSLPTVLQNMQELEEEGLVCKNGTFGSTGGRRATGFSVVGTARYAVGVDINRTHLAVVAASLDGTMLCRKHIHLPFSKTDEYFRLAGDTVNQIIAECALPVEHLLGVGIAVQGIVSEDGETLVYAPLLNMTDHAVQEITGYIDHPCVLLHDADMAALAEIWQSPEIENAVYLSLSTNLGGSVITGRERYRGDHDFAGKLEHMTLFPGGEPCYCGKTGCAETYCSVGRVLQESGCENLEAFFLGLSRQDIRCCAVWEAYVRNLSILLNNVHTLFDCDIILGGYMAEYLMPYLENIKEGCYALDSFGLWRDYIKLARCTLEPVAYGAAIYYISDFIDNI